MGADRRTGRSSTRSPGWVRADRSGRHVGDAGQEVDRGPGFDTDEEWRGGVLPARAYSRRRSRAPREGGGGHAAQARCSFCGEPPSATASSSRASGPASASRATPRSPGRCARHPPVGPQSSSGQFRARGFRTMLPRMAVYSIRFPQTARRNGFLAGIIIETIKSAEQGLAGTGARRGLSQSAAINNAALRYLLPAVWLTER